MENMYYRFVAVVKAILFILFCLMFSVGVAYFMQLWYMISNG